MPSAGAMRAQVNPKEPTQSRQAQESSRRGIIQPDALFALAEVLRTLQAASSAEAFHRIALRILRRASVLCAEHTCNILYILYVLAIPRTACRPNNHHEPKLL